MSLRKRLTVALTATVLVALGLVGVLTFILVNRAQIDQIDAELERAHPPIERAANGGPDNGDGDEDDSAPGFVESVRDLAPGYYAELRDIDGSVLLSVPLRAADGELLVLADADVPMPADGATDDDAVFASIHVAKDESIRVRVSRQNNGEVLVIGRSLESVEHTRRRLLVVLSLATVGALAAAAVLGSWLVRVGLRPLTDVERATAKIGDDDLGRRVPGDDAATEVGELARAVNTMLGRLQESFEQRARDLEALQESEARMRRFVADASHELRTPIAATSAYAELFERGARDRPDDLARAMSGIRSETARMAELVDELLLLAQLDEGRPLAVEPVDLCEIAIEAADAARAVDATRQVAIQLDDVAVVDGDPGRLRQVVDNLIGNVRTHTPPTTRCTVRVMTDHGQAVLSVTDDGPGMSPADAGHAFERFHRADTSRSRASGGSGLGLSIVSAIVEAHHGTVGMEATPGVGTTVTIRLPLGQGS
jgi:two-component system, OmpR family, sensor kinase